MFSTTQISQTDSCRITDAHTPHHSHLQHQNAGSLSHARAYGRATADTHWSTNLNQSPWKLGEDGCPWQLQIVTDVAIISLERNSCITIAGVRQWAGTSRRVPPQAAVFGHRNSNLMHLSVHNMGFRIKSGDIAVQNWFWLLKLIHEVIYVQSHSSHIHTLSYHMTNIFSLDMLLYYKLYYMCFISVVFNWWAAGLFW